MIKHVSYQPLSVWITARTPTKLIGHQMLGSWGDFYTEQQCPCHFPPVFEAPISENWLALRSPTSWDWISQGPAIQSWDQTTNLQLQRWVHYHYTTQTPGVLLLFLITCKWIPVFMKNKSIPLNKINIKWWYLICFSCKYFICFIQFGECCWMF